MKQNKKGNFIKNWYANFSKPDYEIVNRVKWFSIAPLVIIFIGIIVILFGGLNVGLDFTGGSIVKVERLTISTSYKTEFEAILKNVGINEKNAVVTKETNKDSGEEYITVKYQNVKGLTNEEVFEDLKAELEAKYAGVKVNAAEQISASASSELLLNALIAVFVGAILILIYIAFRFKFASGISAIISLVHDVLITISLVAIFGIQINSAFIVAILTIIGYSINGTIVLFDRVRQNEKNPAHAGCTNAQFMDMSLKETFIRNLNLTATTIVPVLVLVIFGFGISSLLEFALPIVFGLIAGAYSSFFVVSPLYVRFANYASLRKQEKLNGGKPIATPAKTKKQTKTVA